MTRTDDTEVPDYQRWLRLDGKRFVVLGAGQGMGRQVSHALAQVGARVFCVDKY
jgi:3-oxoacyl-[acyl-carrier protein] reductase